MKTLWQAAARQELHERLDRLSPSAERRWGTMTAQQMLAHLVDALRMTTGELPVPPRKMPIRFTPLKQLIIYWLPFPKDAPTAAEIIGRAAADWDAERATLGALIEQVARDRHAREWPAHPAFGKLSERAWGVLTYRHIDHHLRQFGV